MAPQWLGTSIVSKLNKKSWYDSKTRDDRGQDCRFVFDDHLAMSTDFYARLLLDSHKFHGP